MPAAGYCQTCRRAVYLDDGQDACPVCSSSVFIYPETHGPETKEQTAGRIALMDLLHRWADEMRRAGQQVDDDALQLAGARMLELYRSGFSSTDCFQLARDAYYENLKDTV